MSVHTCGACDGSGVCQNDHHNYIRAAIDGMFMQQLEDDCPGCGEQPASPGNCSVCGGSGEQDD